MIIVYILSLLILWFSYESFRLYQNITLARTIGLPIRIIPMSPLSPVWNVISIPIFSVLDRLPLKFGSFSRYTRRIWRFHDKASSHVEMGDAFIIVSSRDIWVTTCDPSAIEEIFARKSEFLRPNEIYDITSVYGPNIFTVNPKDWQRHRKAIASAFNEKTNTYIWRESLRQAKDMLSAWTSSKSDGAQGTNRDTRNLSLNVLAAVGFHKSYKFHSSNDKQTSKASLSDRDYRTSLRIVLENAILMLVFSPKVLMLPFLPNKLNRIGQAALDFKQHMMDMVDEEKESARTKQPGTGRLVEYLLRGSDESSSLSIGEILSNIFIINFAGHDTTANALAYAIVLLAANPEVQEWVGEELDTILTTSNPDEWDYDTLFPQLKRCLAIMLETLRLYPAVTSLPKITPPKQIQTLTIDGKQHTIPPKTYVVPSMMATQVHPKYWGADALDWKPTRWIINNSSDTKDLNKEEIHYPKPGMYLPWSEGPRYCPGKKFSQVEFVAVLAVLFCGHRVSVVPLKGETAVQSCERARAVCEDSEYVFSLHMSDGDSLRLRWVEKGE